MIDRKTLDEINDKTDIVALVSEYVSLQKAGKNYKGLCPFHDDTDPSFSVSPEKNIFKCFSCNEGGRPINFYQKINNVTFRQAAIELANRLGINLNIETDSNYIKLKEHDALKEAEILYKYTLSNTVSGNKALDYLIKRGLKKETIDHFNIGYSPNNDVINKLLLEKGFTKEVILNTGLVTSQNNVFKDTFKERIVFPIKDENGNTVGFSGRSINNKGPKYYNSPESAVFQKSDVLYHLYESLSEIRKTKKVILHEGFFDCISSFEANIKNTVATMGTALTLSQAKLIKKYADQVIIAFDGDKAGIEATYKAIEIFKQVNIRVDVLTFPDGLDPDDYLKKHGKEQYVSLYQTNIKDPYAFIYETNKNDLNLKNTNDAAILKNVVRDMLINAPNSVKEHYIKRLSEDLNVTVFSLSGLMKHKEVVVKELPKVVEKKSKTLPNKFYKAERILFINMLKDKQMSMRIDQQIGNFYVCDANIAKLKMLLQFKYYQKHDQFDEEIFIEMINEEQESEILLKTLKSVLNSIEYSGGFLYPDKEIDENIEVLKRVNDHKKYQSILNEVKAETESYQKTILMEKQKEIKLKITKN